ncbi:MAG: dihydroneopterin aldolase [Bacilli bacterium]
MDKIILKEMPFFGYHGVFKEETKLGQRFIIDVDMGLCLRRAGESDDLEQSVNYGEVYAVIKAIVEGPPVKLLEALGENICKAIFENFPKIQNVVVTVKKPSAPIPGILDYAAIMIERNRCNE